MSRFRTVLFWLHLAAGASAGIVILVMCITGVALTYEKQAVEWADSRSWSAPLPAGATHLPPETLLAKVHEVRPGAAIVSLTLRADPKAPATVAADGNQSVLVDPYTGSIVGRSPQGLRTFFRVATSWHRYLAFEGEARATGRMFTGVSNLLFLFIVLSGMYLWIPKTRSWLQLSRIVWFRRRLPAKARHFNWHNVIGIWCAIPLVIIVAGAIPISFSWGNALVYRLAGEQPPAPPATASRSAAPRESTSDRDRQEPPFDGLNVAWSRAMAEIPSWRTVTVRFSPDHQAAWVIAVDSGYGGQPQKRRTLTVDRASGAVVKSEGFSDLTLGRRARSWLRFAHTGEFYGLAGQTIAGIATAGGSVLVYTGLALAVRRLFGWIGRRKIATDDQRQAA